MLSVDCKGCHKWHNKCFCFDDCTNVKSHIKLHGDDYTKFDKYCKECRGERYFGQGSSDVLSFPIPLDKEKLEISDEQLNRVLKAVNDPVQADLENLILFLIQIFQIQLL